MNITQIKNSLSDVVLTNLTTTAVTKAFKPSSIFVQADTCIKAHNEHYCNYISLCILLGYFCRPFVMPFVLHRVEKLNYNLRNDYNFSLSWLWTVATIGYIDILEYFVAKPENNAYSPVINLFNVIHVLITLAVIIRYITFYGFSKTNYSNLVISVIFKIIWLTMLILRVSGHNKLIKPPLSLYLIVYVLFASIQIFKNVSNGTGRCLTHVSFGFYLTSCFFLSSYQISINDNYFNYIHYKNFFEICTLVVILLQNVYYGDKKYENHSLIIMDNVTDNSSNRLKERTNSGVIYFQEEDNVINEEKILNNRSESFKENDEDVFDKGIYLSKINKTKSSIMKIFNPISIDTNDRLQNETSVYEETTQPAKNNDLSFRTRQKTGIFFSYIPSLTWKMILTMFCILYYAFAFITLLRAVKFNYFLILCPSIHPFVILVALIYKKYKNKN